MLEYRYSVTSSSTDATGCNITATDNYRQAGWRSESVFPVSQEAAARRRALERLGLDVDALDRVVAMHEAWSVTVDWLTLMFPMRTAPLPAGRAVPCAAQRRCPARNPLARVSRAPIVAYRADVR